MHVRTTAKAGQRGRADRERLLPRPFEARFLDAVVGSLAMWVGTTIRLVGRWDEGRFLGAGATDFDSIVSSSGSGTPESCSKTRPYPSAIGVEE